MDRWQFLCCLCVCGALSAGPATRPAAPAKTDTSDDADSSSSVVKPAEAATGDSSPTTRSTTEPSSAAEFSLRRAIVILSNGQRITGLLRHLKDQPMRAWSAATKEYQDVPYALIQSIESKIDSERKMLEWHFKDGSSHVKEYTGRTYPARDMEYLFTLTDGQTILGGVDESLQVRTTTGDTVFKLRKSDKGDPGKTLKDLIYVKQIEFPDQMVADADATSPKPKPKSTAKKPKSPQTQPDTNIFNDAIDAGK